MNMSVMSSLHVHKVSTPCEYSGSTAWQLLQPHHLQVSHRREARLCRKLMVGFRDGRRPKTTTSCHSPWYPSGLCEQHHKTVEELVEEADDKLFTNVQHVLHPTFPFITRMLFKEFIDILLVTLLFCVFTLFFTCIIFYFIYCRDRP